MGIYWLIKPAFCLRSNFFGGQDPFFDRRNVLIDSNRLFFVSKAQINPYIWVRQSVFHIHFLKPCQFPFGNLRSTILLIQRYRLQLMHHARFILHPSFCHELLWQSAQIVFPLRRDLSPTVGLKAPILTITLKFSQPRVALYLLVL